MCVQGSQCSEIHAAKLRDRAGRSLDPIDYTAAGTAVPPGHVYVASAHPDGYDSRYLGLIAPDQILGELTQLITG